MVQASPVWQKVACPARKSKRQLNAGWRRLRERSARRNEQLNARGGIEGPDVSSTRGCGGAYESAPRAVASSSTRGVDPLTRTRSARAAVRGAAQRAGWDRLRELSSRAERNRRWRRIRSARGEQLNAGRAALHWRARSGDGWTDRLAPPPTEIDVSYRPPTRAAANTPLPQVSR